MAGLLPPYLNKLVEKLQKEYEVAQKKTLKAKKAFEFAQEYEQLCKERLDATKTEAEPKNETPSTEITG